MERDEDGDVTRRRQRELALTHQLECQASIRNTWKDTTVHQSLANYSKAQAGFLAWAEPFCKLTVFNVGCHLHATQSSEP